MHLSYIITQQTQGENYLKNSPKFLLLLNTISDKKTLTSLNNSLEVQTRIGGSGEEQSLNP